MNRREFIVQMGAALIAVPAILSLESCGGNDGSSDGFFDVSSSADSGHTHSVRVLNSDITNQPGNGVQYTSTNVNSHTHIVTLSQSDLATINNGGQVSVNSSTDAGHLHAWTIQKPQ
jgi:hypothetical protein